MSIKGKTTILFIGTFILNIALLFAFFYYNFGGNIDKKLMDNHEAFNQQVNQVITQVDGKSYQEVITILEQFNEEYVDRSYKLQKLEFIPDKTIVPPPFNEESPGGFGFSRNEIITLDNEQYMLFITEEKTTLHSGKRASINDIIYSLMIFECVIVFLLFIMQRFVFNKILVQPLIKMKENIDNFKEGKMVFHEIERKDEIGDLEFSFQTMAISLEEEKEIQ